MQKEAQVLPPLLHLYGKQETDGGVTQVPPALQMLAGVKTSPLHVSALQSEPVAYVRHPPAPSHLPSSPHVTGAVATQTPRGSGAPDATGTHRPGEAARLQLRQGPRHALSQQTPSVQ